jgi:hypothetical protein
VKALSLWEPWAMLIALQLKRFETRSWSTTYRGPIAIHAAKKWNRSLRTTCKHIMRHYDVNLDSPPLGAFVAIAELVEIYPTARIRDTLSLQERDFGDYSSNRFAWQLENIQAIESVPARGYQGIWNLDTETILLLQSKAI